MSTQQTQQRNPNSAPNQTPLSFDDVSKLFSLPLSDAAETLGVCTSVLKKICHENGLVRWPHRKVQEWLGFKCSLNSITCGYKKSGGFKDHSHNGVLVFLSGKSIEEIKKDAARERNKQLAELSKGAGARNDALASSAASSSLGSQPQNKITSSVQELSKSRGILQQQGNKNLQNGKPHNLHSSNITKGTLASLDEFKYGFPSDGLSTASNRWWGSSNPDNNEDIHGSGGEYVQERKKEFKELADDGASLLLIDTEKSETGRYESSIGPQGIGLLSTVRKGAVEEGQEALKLGIYRGSGVNKLGRRERMLLLRIFKSLLPSQWRYGSF